MHSPRSPAGFMSLNGAGRRSSAGAPADTGPLASWDAHSEPAVTQQQIFARQGLDQLGEQFWPTLSPRPEQDPSS